jgi:hypothetical protein
LTRHAAVLIATLACAAGCNQKPDEAPNVGPVGGTAPAAAAEPEAGELNGKLSKLMVDLTARYRPLDYEYDEELLETLDRVEARLAGKSEALEPLPMPKLDEAEQLDHFRETVKRWSAKTGKSLRAEIDPLKAEVAARKPGGPSFHPDFHKRFSAAFDDFIPIEVAEVRERRNKALHEQAKPLLDEYRSRAPDAVKSAEQTLNAPPYNLPQ